MPDLPCAHWAQLRPGDAAHEEELAPNPNLVKWACKKGHLGLGLNRAMLFSFSTSHKALGPGGFPEDGLVHWCATNPFCCTASAAILHHLAMA